MSEKPLPSNLTRSQLLSLLQQQEALLSNPIIKNLADGGAKIINKIAQIKNALEELKGNEKDVLVDAITNLNIVDTDIQMSDTKIEQTNHHTNNNNSNKNKSDNHNNNNNNGNYKPSKGKEKAVPMFSTTTPPNKAKKENRVKVIEISESLKLEQYWKRQEIEQHHRALDHHSSNEDWANEEDLDQDRELEEQDQEQEQGEGDLNESELWQGTEEGDLFDEAFVNGISGFFRTQPATTPQVAQNLEIFEHGGEWDLDENLTMDIVPPEFEKS